MCFAGLLKVLWFTVLAKFLCMCFAGLLKVLWFTVLAKAQRFAKPFVMNENELAKLAVDICFKIHLAYGPGLFESVYERIFLHEWEKTKLPVIVHSGIKVIHEGINMGIGFIPDVVIGNKVILEFKSVENLADVHRKQLLTYLRLSNLKLGLLVNFNVPVLKNGIYRIVNNL